ncbi:AbrB family transcriptional regulator [Martelella soudanensis]|uniref:AbrB family transcriptional regulator n=1 Tax=unclassified Martelella TaxID=2629616 RepID=UPI0015DD7788|nr:MULTISPECIES: AbrB family transcriptional regulator [unclassified Martelella]
MNEHVRYGLRLLVILAVASAGAWVAIAARMPLPWMLGPLVAAAVVAMAKPKVFGAIPVMPTTLRNIFIPVIGLMIGSQVTRETLVHMGQWWPSLLLVVPFALVTQMISFALLKKMGGYDRATAFFASSPGGVVEAVIISERFKGDPTLTVVQHLARISLAVTIVPLLLTLYIGHPVGSASGASMPDALNPIGLMDTLLLAAAAVIGAYVARKINLPAANMLGPMITSAALHSTGLTFALIPTSLVQITQLVIGASLGGRFAAVDMRTLYKSAVLSLPLLVVSLSVAAVAGLTVSMLGYNSVVVGFISFAPGGVTEMGLIALSIDADPVYVACHHIVRILTAVLFLPLIYRFLIAPTRQNQQSGTSGDAD